MNERTGSLQKILNLTLIAAVGLSAPACGQRRPMVNPDGSALTTEQAEAWADPNIPDPTALPTATLVPPNDAQTTEQNQTGNFGSAPPPDFALRAGDPNYIQNLMTQAFFKLREDPKSLGRQCVELETYWEGNSDYPQGNKQDVVGAAVSLGPDRGNYRDITGPVSVYDAGANFIGSFTTDNLPDHTSFGTVQPGTVVCDSSNTFVPDEHN